MQGSFFVRIRRILRGRFVPATGPAASPSPFRYGVGHNPRRARAVPGFVPVVPREMLATAYVRTCVNPALRSPSAECSGRSAGCPGIGIFRDLFQRGCLWDPFVFFGRSFASERSIRVSVPGARSVALSGV